MKNAINILLRNGFEVSYLIPRRIWTFFFKEEKNHALCVQVAPHQNNQPGLLIRIKGPNAHEIGFLFNPADYLALTGLTSCWDCLDGSIFICTSQNPNHDRSDQSSLFGRIYRRGLFVNVDQKLKALKLLVNFNAKSASRDRFVLELNTWQLIENLLTQTLDQSPSLADHLLAVCRGLPSSSLDPVLGHVREPLRKHFAKLTGKHSVCFIEKDDSDLKKSLEAINCHVVVAGILDDKIHIQALVRDFLDSEKDFMKSDFSHDEIIGFESLTQLAVAIRVRLQAPVELFVKDIPDVLCTFSPFCIPSSDYKHSRIIVGRHSLSRPGVIGVACVLFHRFTFGSNLSLQQQLLWEYSQHPRKFRAQRSSKSSRSLGAFPSSAADFKKKQQSETPFVETTRPDISSTPALMHPQTITGFELHQGFGQLNSISELPQSIPSNEGERSSSILVDRCSIPSLQRFDLHLGTVYSKPGVIPNLPSELWKEAKREIDTLKEKLGKALNQNISVMFANCNEHIKGFSYQGRIFVNLAALSTIEPSLRQGDLFLTLLHELTHLALRQPHHDSHFADELAKLAMAVRDCGPH